MLSAKCSQLPFWPGIPPLGSGSTAPGTSFLLHVTSPAQRGAPRGFPKSLSPGTESKCPALWLASLIKPPLSGIHTATELGRALKPECGANRNVKISKKNQLSKNLSCRSCCLAQAGCKLGCGSVPRRKNKCEDEAGVWKHRSSARAAKSVSALLEGKSSRGTYTSRRGKILISSRDAATLVSNLVYSRADTPWGPFGNLWQPGKASTESGSYKQASWCPLASFLHEKKRAPIAVRLPPHCSSLFFSLQGENEGAVSALPHLLLLPHPAAP